ncbi:MAG TPA: TlpA disulfide reductase family protein [Anaeromyxobacteraceae bacterium]|nr:TlpA disulfide reductase family protein [Anaeromyxobacteraceae bacterium]
MGQLLALSVRGLEGRVVDIAADRGKVRVIDFWATWCEQCKEALPALEGLARELGPRGLSVYGIAIDEDRRQVQAFLEKRPLSFPVLWDKGAVEASRFFVNCMPMTLIVDRGGLIRYQHQGWEEDSAAKERREVEALLSES